MYLKHFFILLSILLLLSIEIYAANLNITKITNTDNKINIEFNNTLRLSNFTLENNNLISPFYENKGNKHYFFYFLNRDFKTSIINVINKKENINNNSKEKIEYKINKCSIVKNPKTILAFMSVIFNDNIEISCNILNGKYGLWVAWPSIKDKDKWNKLFEIKDKKLKEEIETNLIKYYKEKKNANKLKKE
jgi:DNA-binding cell septation regulator SpoVG